MKELMRSACAGFFSPLTDAKAITGLVLGSYMNVLLVTVPLGWAAAIFHWGPIANFLLVNIDLLDYNNTFSKNSETYEATKGQQCLQPTEMVEMPTMIAL